MVYPAKLSLNAILDAAEQILDMQGVAALGMRSVAEQLGVRATSLYKHVGDLAGLQERLAERFAEQLTARLSSALSTERAASAHDDSPRPAPPAALSVVAREYLMFASEHAARYQLLTTEFVAGERDPAPRVARKALWNLLLGAVGELTHDPDDTSAAVATWAYLHGFVALQQAGLFGASGPRDGFERGISALLRGLPRASS